MMAVMKGDGHPAPRMRTQNSMRSARAATSINEHSDDDGGGRAWGTRGLRGMTQQRHD